MELCTCIPLGIAAGFLFPYYLRTRVYTIPEFLEMRYNATARAFFSALMLVISIMTKMAFHLYAGALVLHGLIGWDIMEPGKGFTGPRPTAEVYGRPDELPHLEPRPASGTAQDQTPSR